MRRRASIPVDHPTPQRPEPRMTRILRMRADFVRGRRGLWYADLDGSGRMNADTSLVAEGFSPALPCARPTPPELRFVCAACRPCRTGQTQGFRHWATREESARTRPDPPISAYQRPLWCGAIASRGDPGLSPLGYETKIRVNPPRSAPIRVPETVVVQGVCEQGRTGLKPSATRKKIRANPPRPAPIRVPETVPPRRTIRANPQNPRPPRFRSFAPHAPDWKRHPCNVSAIVKE